MNKSHNHKISDHGDMRCNGGDLSLKCVEMLRKEGCSNCKFKSGGLVRTKDSGRYCVDCGRDLFPKPRKIEKLRFNDGDVLGELRTEKDVVVGYHAHRIADKINELIEDHNKLLK